MPAKKISNEEAFKPLPNERNIGIEHNYNFRFNRRWFRQRNQKTWSTFFTEKFSNKEPVNMIQIGVFEGMDLVWCLQNILGHPDSHVLAIDPWAATRKLDQAAMDEFYDNARHNLRPWRHQVQIVRGESFGVLTDYANTAFEHEGKIIRPGEWDLIVIDGDHNQSAVYDDAVMSYNLAKVGGWLVFDDVRNRVPKKHHVYHGLSDFVDDYEGAVELVWQNRYCDCYAKVE